MITYPNGPSQIGLLREVSLTEKGTFFEVESIDLPDRAQLVNTKPYVPNLDRRNTRKIAWVERRTFF